MKILSIETSGRYFSICLNEDQRVIYEVSQDRDALCEISGKGLFNEVDKIIRALGRERLSLIVVSIGPGMFTSLRVGLSLAKGLSFTLKVPIIPVNTLDAIGYTLTKFYDENHLIVPAINAYQNEIYTAIYYKNVRNSDYLLIKPQQLLELIENEYAKRFKEIVIAGSGATIIKGTENSFDAQLFYLDEASFRLTSSMLIPFALLISQKTQFSSPDFLEPFYIKKTAPERK